MAEVKGFKVFNPDWTCRNKQYTCPGKFEEDVTPMMCNTGMHFCRRATDCFNYYKFNPENHVAEVIAYGDIAENGDKTCTNKLEIVREIPWTEVLEIVNMGKSCTGLCNSGDCNSGDWNSGDWNSGNQNSGNQNSGNRNSGDCNSGNQNSGDCNSGNRNSGDCNSGNQNSGNQNSGDCNSGDWNSGDWNSGNQNSGDCNSGDWNSGNQNSGDCNSGDCNSGDWNKTSFSNGCFNTEEPEVYMFNKPSGMTYRQWLNSDARYLLKQIPHWCLSWVWPEDMTDEEKKAHPEHETTGGYLKKLDESDNAQIWWNGLNEHDRNVIKALPNFDAVIFEKCTGIKIGG